MSKGSKQVIRPASARISVLLAPGGVVLMIPLVVVDEEASVDAALGDGGMPSGN